ncbi:MAG: O-antigen ligase family protein [Pseudomonadales bacterium]
MKVFAAIVLFAIYLNVPAVAVREFGVPFFAGAAIPLLLAIPLAHSLVVRGEPLRLPGLLIAGMILLAVHAVSAYFAVRPDESFDRVLEWALEGVLLTALIVNVFRTRADAIAAVVAVVTAGAVMGAIVLLQQALDATDSDFFGFGQLDAELVSDQGTLQRRLAGPIGETNRFAQIMAVLIPMAAALAITSRGLQRLGYWFMTALITGGMALAFSRGVIVALVLAVPFALLFNLLKLRHVAFGLLGGLLLMLMLPHYAERVVSIGDVAIQTLGLSPHGLRNADGAARGRLTEMKSTALVFADHPLLGAGPGMAQVLYADYAPVVGGKVRPGQREAHNLYLQLAAETGIIGLAVFATVIVFAFSGLERARKRLAARDYRLWGLACGMELALIIYLGTSLFLHSAYIRYLWMLLGLCVIVASADRLPLLIHLLGRMLAETVRSVRSREVAGEPEQGR